MYPRRVHFFAYLLLLTLSVTVRADQVDDYVKAQMERQHIPGVSIVVIKDQKVVKSMGYGLANVELNVAARRDQNRFPLRFTPGEKYEYCNVGYFTLAEIISKVGGKPWPDFLRERVFAPLGMNSTRTTNMTDLVTNRANGYVWRDGKFQNAAIYLARSTTLSKTIRARCFL